MKIFKYIEPDIHGKPVEVAITEGDIILTYFDYWKSLMAKKGLINLITEENCVKDFCTVNYAWEVKNDTSKQ
jgi:hypothetical protein